jgi:ABC-type uncharacterized transport system involved in gliding motility auxiliary subunit
MTSPSEKPAGLNVWRYRGRRVATGLNVLVSLLLAAAALGMVNYLGQRYVARWDLSRRDYYRLSERTLGLIDSLSEPVTVVAFFQRSHVLFDDVRSLLKEYEYAAAAAGRSDRFRVELVDPDRDLSRTRELAREYGVQAPNVVVFRCAGRSKFVEPKDMAEYHYLLKDGRSVEKKKVGFLGEQAFSSAILSVAQSARPVVYFLTGHGERSIDDYSKMRGFSDAARMMRRDNMDVKPLVMAETGGLPADASLVVVAAPDRAISQAERDMLAAYADRGGRVLVLLATRSDGGLRDWLARWGVRVGDDTVAGLSLTGRDLLVRDFGDHPMTSRLKDLTVMFYGPRSVEPLDGAAQGPGTPPDRPRVTVVARSTAEGWAEQSTDQQPPVFDEGQDRRGPIGVAVASEKGSAAGVDVQIKPTRLVVMGDCDFVSNGGLASGVGGNVDFFLACVNWLVEREALMAILPRIPGELRVDMTPERWRLAYAIALGGVPMAVLALGALVALARRR